MVAKVLAECRVDVLHECLAILVLGVDTLSALQRPVLNYQSYCQAPSKELARVNTLKYGIGCPEWTPPIKELARLNTSKNGIGVCE